MNRQYTLIMLICLLVFGFQEVNAQFNMSNASVADCSGSLYDSGGLGPPGGNYSANEDYVFTICPPGAQCVSIEFFEFFTENNVDVLSIYDGPTTASPLIGSYSGNLAGAGGITGTVRAGSGCMTLAFSSDGGVNADGWNAFWNCFTTPCETQSNFGPNNDCSNSFVVCDAQTLNFNSNGPGSIADLNAGNNGCLNGNEHQSAWYTFQLNPLTPPGSSIGFTIDPVGGSDYDFAVYGPDMDCTLGSDPIACSYAGATSAFFPQTGMGNGAIDASEGPTGDGFVSPLTVNPGETYIVIIDNFTGDTQGFNLFWNGDGANFLNCTICLLELTADPVAPVCPDTVVDLEGFVSEASDNLLISWSLLADPGGFTFGSPNSLTTDLTPPPGFFGTVTAVLSVEDLDQPDCAKVVEVPITYIEPTVLDLIDQSLFEACVNQEVIIDYTGALPATPSILWDFDGGFTDVGDNTFQGPHTITWSVLGVKEIILSVSDGQCESTISTFVDVQPQLDDPIIPACVSTSTSATFDWDDVPGAVEYLVTYFVNGDPIGVSSTELVSELMVTPLLPNDEVYIEVVATSPGFCNSNTTTSANCIALPCTDPDPFEINIPAPICVNVTSVLITATPAAVAPATGEFSGANIDAAGNFDPVAAGIGDHSVAYTYTADGCTATTNGTIEVIGLPTATFTVSDATICVDNEVTINFTGSASAGATFTWDFDGGTADPSTGAGPHTVTWSTIGTKTIGLIVDDGCESLPVIVEVDVEEIALPTIDNLDNIYCFGEGDLVALTGTPAGGSFTTTSAGLAGGNFVIDAAGVGMHTITYTYTDPTNGCVVSDDFDTEIIAPPSGTISAASDPICVGESVVISYVGTSGTPTIYNWNFNGGNPSVAMTGDTHNVNWSTSGVKNITLMVTEEDCSSAVINLQVTVEDPLEDPVISCGTSSSTEVNFDWADITNAVEYEYTVLINASPDGNGTQTTNNSSLQVGGLSPLDVVEVTVTAIGSGACGNSNPVIWSCTAQDCPVETVTIAVPTSFCQNDPTASISVLPTGGVIGYIDEGVSPQDTIPIVDFNPSSYSPGTYTLVYTYSSGDCFYYANQDVSVFAVPVADIDVPTTVCVGDAIDIDFIGTAGPAAIFDWDFDSGSPATASTEGPHSVSWATAGTKTVTLDLTENGCASPQATATIDVVAPIDAPTIICSALSQTEVSFSWDPIPGVTDFSITVLVDPEDGSGSFTSVSDQITTSTVYTESGLAPLDEVTITVIPVGSGICGNGASSQQTCIAADCPPLDLQIIDLPGAICDNSAVIPLTTNQGGGDFVIINSGGTVTPITEIDPAAIGSGNYNIEVVFLQGDCSYTDVQALLINEAPTSSFSIPTEACVDEVINFSNSGVLDFSATYNWTFEDGNPSTATGAGPHPVSFISGGTKNVELEVIALNTCSTVTSQTIDIESPLAVPAAACGTTTQTSVELTWNPVADASGYDLFITVVPADGGANYTIDEDNWTDSPFDVTGLSPGDEVILDIEAIGFLPCGNSQSSSITCTAQNCTPVDVPVVSCDATDLTSASFSWAAVAGVTEYILQATVTPGDGGAVYTVDEAAYVGVDYTVTPLGPEDQVDFSVIAVGDAICGNSLAGTASCSSDACIPLDVPPVSCGALTQNSVEFTWGAIAGVTEYVLQATVTPDDGGAPYTIDEATYTGTDYTVSSLSPEDQVDLSVIAIGDAICGNSLAGITTCSAEACIPLAVPNVSCGTLTQNSVEFTWDAIPAVTDYEITIVVTPVSGAPTTDIQTITTNSIDVTGLLPLDQVEISVIAIGDAICGDSTAGIQTCIAQDCPAETVEILGFPSSFCEGDGSVPVVVNPSGGELFVVTVALNDTTALFGDFDPSSYTAGDYVLYYEFTIGACEYSDSHLLTINSAPIASFTSDITSVCAGNDVVFTFDGTAGAGASFDWDFGPDATPATANTEGPHTVNWSAGGTPQVTLSVTESGTCSDNTDSTITVEAPLADPVVVCSTTSQTEVGFSWGAVSGANEYYVVVTVNSVSTFDGNLPDLTYSETGLVPGDIVDITVQALNAGTTCNDSNTASAQCTAQDCPVLAVSITNLNSSYCTLDAATVLIGDPVGGEFSGPGVDTPTNTFDPSTLAAGDYTISYSYSDPTSGCPYATTANVSIVDLPVADFIMDQDLVCTGSSVTITNTGDTGAGNYIWDFDGAVVSSGSGEGPYSVNWNNPGSYNITLTIETGDCTSLEVIQTIDVTELEVLVPGLVVVPDGSSSVLEVNTFSALTDSFTYVWSPSDALSCTDCEDPIVTPLTDGTYTVVISDTLGCSVTETIQVRIEIEPEIEKALLPSAFSPNGDNVNDIFRIVGSKVTAVEYRVFNRWGEQVFELQTSDLLMGWDGNHRGEAAEIGAYVYWAQVVFESGDSKIYKGNVTLVR